MVKLKSVFGLNDCQIFSAFYNYCKIHTHFGLYCKSLDEKTVQTEVRPLIWVYCGK